MNTATHLMNPSPIKTPRMPACAGHLSRANLPRRLTLSLFLLCAALLARPCVADPGQWTYTGSLNTGRTFHTATLLANGKVLVAGGEDDNSAKLNSAELYDPATGSWTYTGSLNIERAFHSAILLPDGKVLVEGGLSAGGSEATAELYDPASGMWSFTGSSNFIGGAESLVVLPSGQVLGVRTRDAELYDPASGTWRLTGSLNEKHLAVLFPLPLILLPNGLVLIEGGTTGAHYEPIKVAELYDPSTETWTETGSLQIARSLPIAVLLPNGLVLVAGPEDTSGAELYDPSNGRWTLTGPPVPTTSGISALTLLPTGSVLGNNGSDAQLYDPATQTWSLTGSLQEQQIVPTTTLLANGKVLVAGGEAFADLALNAAELYDSGVVAATQVSGRGSIDGQGDQASFNFHASQSGDRPSGSLSFSDPAAAISITKAKIRTLTFNGNSADLGGNARLGDGTRVTYSVSVTDNSSDGSSDTFSISLSNGYSAGGTLTSGDITVQ
jgi:hypothetical protein